MGKEIDSDVASEATFVAEAEQKKDGEEPQQGNAEETGEPKSEDDDESKPKTTKLKKKEMKAILEMEMTFKKVGFEQALTDEEKAARKAARLARKGKKKGKKGKPKEEAKEAATLTDQEVPAAEEAIEAPLLVEPTETVSLEPTETVSLEPTETKEKKGKKKKKEEGKEEKKGKKGKKKGKKKYEEAEEEERRVQEAPAEPAPTEELPIGEEKPAEEVEPPTKEKKGKKGVGRKGKGVKESTKPSAETVSKDDKKKAKGKGKKKRMTEETPSELAIETPEGTETGEAGDMEEKKRKKEEEHEPKKKGRKETKAKSSVSFARADLRERKSKRSRSLSSSYSGSTATYLSGESDVSDEEEEYEEEIRDIILDRGKRQKRKKGIKMKKEKTKKEKEESKEKKAEVTIVEKPEIKELPTEEKKVKKKKKKGKKKSEEATPKEDEGGVLDVMAEIRKMKALAEAQATGQVVEDVVEAPVKKKQKKEKKKKKKVAKKSMSKQERVRLATELAEQAKIQAELEAQRLLEEEKKRIQQERKMAREVDNREILEQALRVEQLTYSMSLIKTILDYNWNLSNKAKLDAEWAQYLKCDGLPDPINPPQMNTYLYLWDQVINDVTVEEVTQRTDEILRLLETLQDYVDDPFNVKESLVKDWLWIRDLCRQHQQENLNMATYRLLKDVDSRLNRLDIPTADYEIKNDNFYLSLYVLVQLPTPMFNPRNVQKKRLEIDFPDIKMKVVYPVTIDTKFMATRAMYIKYDHLSDSSASYKMVLIPQEYQKDMFEATSEEWFKQMVYKYENRKRPQKTVVEDEFGNITEIEPPPEPEVPEGTMPPTVPFQILDPPAIKYVVALEDELYATNRETPCISVDENVIHLRKYLIIGGIYCLELFYQPPQPADMVAFEVRLTALKLPKRLEEVPMHVEYVPPPPEDPLAQKTPEQLEEDIKRQEECLDALIVITLTLPEHVIFLDLPTVCRWDDQRKVWTTDDIIDVKHIEEQNYLTFRTGSFGPFSLAVNRLINFPFQMWEIRPEGDGTVTFQLTCAILMIEFHIKGSLICMTQLQNSPNNALQDIVGTYFKLPKLIRLMRDGGIDIFPAYDTFCYVQGICEKQWPMEKHLYYNMAQLSPCYNFCWSRWNAQVGRRSAVLQMREYRPDKPKQKNHVMLLVTPLKAVHVDCTEVSQTFNETPIESMKFYSDLFHLMKGTTGMIIRNKVLNGPQDVVKAVADVLIATRILSFS